MSKQYWPGEVDDILAPWINLNKENEDRIAFLETELSATNKKAEKANEQAATYRGMYECQKEYCDHVVVGFTKLEIERDRLLARVTLWETFCREWADEETSGD